MTGWTSRRRAAAAAARCVTRLRHGDRQRVGDRPREPRRCGRSSVRRLMAVVASCGLLGATPLHGARRRRRRSSACVAGERQEHVVEASARGAASVVGVEIRRGRGRARPRARSAPRRPLDRIDLDGRSLDVGGADDLQDAADPFRSTPASGARSRRWWRRARPSAPSAVPLAMTRPWSMTTMLVGEPVGLLQVLRGEQHGRALGRRARSMTSHRSLRLLRVEAGRRLVEEEHRRAVDEGGGEVEAAAHAAGVGARPAGRRRRRGRSARAARRPRPHGLRLRRWVSRPTSAEVLAAGEVLVDGGVLAGEADALAAPPAGAAATSMPSTVARPASGRRMVVRIRTAVVLPAPFGPSRPSTVAGGTSKSTPSRATTAPKLLRRPSTTMAGPLVAAPWGWRSWGEVMASTVAPDR